MTLDLIVLESYLAVLRKHGVAHIEGLDIQGAGRCVIAFHKPMAPPPEPDYSPIMPKPGTILDASNAGMCHCGHEVLEHGGEGFCLRGCDAALCEKGPLKPTQ